MPQPIDPTDLTLCRVWGDFELPTNELPFSPIEVQFDLIVPSDGPVKSDRVVVTRRVKAEINEAGNLFYKGNPYVDLVKTSSLTPNTATWTITCKPLGFIATSFTPTTATFDISTLIT